MPSDALKGLTVAHVMDRLAHRLPNRRSRSNRTLEPRQMTHFKDRAEPAAAFAEHDAMEVAELDLARSVRSVAALVLEALDH